MLGVGGPWALGAAGMDEANDLVLNYMQMLDVDQSLTGQLRAQLQRAPRDKAAYTDLVRLMGAAGSRTCTAAPDCADAACSPVTDDGEEPQDSLWRSIVSRTRDVARIVGRAPTSDRGCALGPCSGNCCPCARCGGCSAFCGCSTEGRNTTAAVDPELWHSLVCRSLKYCGAPEAEVNDLSKLHPLFSEPTDAEKVQGPAAVVAACTPLVALGEGATADAVAEAPTVGRCPPRYESLKEAIAASSADSAAAAAGGAPAGRSFSRSEGWTMFSRRSSAAVGGSGFHSPVHSEVDARGEHEAWSRAGTASGGLASTACGSGGLSPGRLGGGAAGASWVQALAGLCCHMCWRPSPRRPSGLGAAAVPSPRRCLGSPPPSPLRLPRSSGAIPSSRSRGLPPLPDSALGGPAKDGPRSEAARAGALGDVPPPKPMESAPPEPILAAPKAPAFSAPAPAPLQQLSDGAVAVSAAALGPCEPVAEDLAAEEADSPPPGSGSARTNSGSVGGSPVAATAARLEVRVTPAPRASEPTPWKPMLWPSPPQLPGCQSPSRGEAGQGLLRLPRNSVPPGVLGAHMFIASPKADHATADAQDTDDPGDWALTTRPRGCFGDGATSRSQQLLGR